MKQPYIIDEMHGLFQGTYVCLQHSTTGELAYGYVIEIVPLGDREARIQLKRWDADRVDTWYMEYPEWEIRMDKVVPQPRCLNVNFGEDWAAFVVSRTSRKQYKRGLCSNNVSVIPVVDQHISARHLGLARLIQRASSVGEQVMRQLHVNYLSFRQAYNYVKNCDRVSAAFARTGTIKATLLSEEPLLCWYNEPVGVVIDENTVIGEQSTLHLFEKVFKAEEVHYVLR